MTLSKIREALAYRVRGEGRIWHYQVSHQWLIIRVTKQGVAGNFHLKCGGCDRVEFHPSWQLGEVQIEHNESGYLVSDGKHLRVECGVLEGEYNVPPVFSIVP